MIERLTVLGAGTILAVPGYGCSGYLLHWRGDGGESHPILIDCGSGTLDRLCEQGTSPDAVDIILVSHFHADHVSDLAPFLLSRWLHNLGNDEAHHVTIVGPVGLSDHVSRVTELNLPWMAEYRFDIVELGSGGRWRPDDARYRGLRLATTLTGHTENSICFRIGDGEGRSLFYSGDTDYNEELLPLADEADLALVECSKPDDQKLAGHLTPRLAGRLAQRAGVRRLLLTHFYREVLGVDIVGAVGEEYEGEVLLAKKLEGYPIAAQA